MKNIKSIIFLFIYTFFCVSINSCTFEDDFICYVKDFNEIYGVQKDKKTIVIVGTKPLLEYEQLFPSNYLLRKFDKFNFVYCDASSRSNVHLQYILHINKFPIIVFLSTSGQIEFFTTEVKNLKDLKNLISNQDLFHNDNLTSDYYLETGEELLKLVNNLFASHLEIYSKKNLEKAQEYLTISQPESIYFYQKYMEYNVNRGIYRDGIQDSVLRMLITCSDGDPIYQYLNTLIRRDIKSLEFPIIIGEFNINIGNVKKDEIISRKVPYFNSGRSDLVLMDALPSCNCIRVEYPRVIKSGEFGMMELTYKANEDDNAGEFIRSITFLSNTEKGNETIYIKGNLLN